MPGNVDGLGDLEQLADGLDDFAGRGPDSMDATIADALPRLFERDVVPATRRKAREHVGEYAETIDGHSGGWTGGKFRYGLGSDSVVVESHEYGSGKYNPSGGSSFGRREGYRIPAETGDGPVVIGSNGREQVVEYVVHPGVKPKRFMQRTVTQKSDDVASDIGDAVADALERQLDF